MTLNPSRPILFFPLTNLMLNYWDASDLRKQLGTPMQYTTKYAKMASQEAVKREIVHGIPLPWDQAEVLSP